MSFTIADVIALDAEVNETLPYSQLPTPADMRRLRVEAGIGTALAAAVLGVHALTLFAWEDGRRLPSKQHDERVRKFLGVCRKRSAQRQLVAA
jgi:DNA-binding transcriptional regulator YiaG